MNILFCDIDGNEYLLDPEAACTAQTKRGRQCRNPVFHGQEWVYDDEGYAVFLDDVAYYRALDLRCHVHADENWCDCWGCRKRRGEE